MTAGVLLFAALLAAARAPQPVALVALDANSGDATLENRGTHALADALAGSWELRREGLPVADGRFAVPPIPPGGTGFCGLSDVPVLAADGADVTLVLSFARKAASAEGPAGAVVARDEAVVSAGRPDRFVRAPSAPGTVAETADAFLLSGGGSTAVVSRTTGTLARLALGGVEVLDGDAAADARPLAVRAFRDGEAVVTVVRLAGANAAGGWEHERRWRLGADGALTVAHAVSPFGRPPSPRPRLGSDWRLPDATGRVRWFGRGPGGSGPERRAAAVLGVYAATADALAADGGARPTDVRWAEFADAAGRGVRFAADAPFAFRAGRPGVRLSTDVAAHGLDEGSRVWTERLSPAEGVGK